MTNTETPQERYEKSSDEELTRLVANAEFMVGNGNDDETVNRIAFESRAELNRRATTATTGKVTNTHHVLTAAERG